MTKKRQVWLFCAILSIISLVAVSTYKESTKIQETEHYLLSENVNRNDNLLSVCCGELKPKKEKIYPKIKTKNLVKTKPKKSATVDKYELIAEAAKAQIGVYQDCTMLVTNSLATVGIYFHGWPEEYSTLGEWTNSPVPGDLIIYSGHIAIYVGDGMAVHGGWMGYTTVLSTVECTNPLIGYIHVYK